MLLLNILRYVTKNDTQSHPCVAEFASTRIKSAACGDADVAESVVLLACPLGPIPPTARGLAAVLARDRPGGRS